MESYQQDREGMSISIAHNPVIANTELIIKNSEASNSHNTSIQQQTPSVTNNKDASVNTKTSAGSIYFKEQYIQNKGLPQTAKDILLSFWRNSTKGRSASAYRK